MKFTILNLAQDVLTDLGLPVMTYEVPSAYLESANCEPNHLPLDGLLYALQVRAAEETVDWLKLAPAMDRLASFCRTETEVTRLFLRPMPFASRSARSRLTTR